MKTLLVGAALVGAAVGVVAVSTSSSATPDYPAEIAAIKSVAYDQSLTAKKKVQKIKVILALYEQQTTTTTTTTGVCASSKANVIDGSDGNGGCFPGPSNTGPSGPLTSYTGPCTITTPNTVIDSKTVNCDLAIKTTGVQITNDHINGAVLEDTSDQTSSFSIDHSLIDGHDSRGYACINCGVGYRHFTIDHTEITGTNRGAYCINDCTIRNTWVHGTDLEPCQTCAAHASGFRDEANTRLIHDSIACDYTGPNPSGDLGCSADISGYPDFAPIHDNTWDGNLMLASPGPGYCAYGGDTQGKPYSGDPLNATNIVVKNNVWQRGSTGKCGSYGPITSFSSTRSGNVWSNNKWDDGTAVPPAD